MTAAPKKAIEVKLTANGFTWGEVIRALKQRVARLEEHHENGVGVSAYGYGASHTADVELRDVTREQFADESIVWLEARREAERAEAALTENQRAARACPFWEEPPR